MNEIERVFIGETDRPAPTFHRIVESRFWLTEHDRALVDLEVRAGCGRWMRVHYGSAQLRRAHAAEFAAPCRQCWPGEGA